uniref:Uncharacterized protein n=1 Tax=uncultured prokaryote TaxID=198431 RepID=A0A0H5Q8F4_9ZZZZ|nr:hypothetical protein [uncultured prokaryote]
MGAHLDMTPTVPCDDCGRPVVAPLSPSLYRANLALHALHCPGPHSPGAEHASNDDHLEHP